MNMQKELNLHVIYRTYQEYKHSYMYDAYHVQILMYSRAQFD